MSAITMHVLPLVASANRYWSCGWSHKGRAADATKAAAFHGRGLS